MHQVKHFVSHAFSWLAAQVYLQLFLMVASAPLLLWWGFPLSLLAIVGNILFSPIITVFLLICLALFLTELLGVPNGVIVWILEGVCHSWLWLLELVAGYRTLVTISRPSLIGALVLMAAAISVVYSPWGKAPLWGMGALLVLAIGFGCFLW